MKTSLVLAYRYRDQYENPCSGLVGVYSQKQHLFDAICFCGGYDNDQKAENKDLFVPNGKNLNYRRMCDALRTEETKRIVIKNEYGEVVYSIWECPVNQLPSYQPDAKEWWHQWELGKEDE